MFLGNETSNSGSFFGNNWLDAHKFLTLESRNIKHKLLQIVFGLPKNQTLQPKQQDECSTNTTAQSGFQYFQIFCWLPPVFSLIYSKLKSGDKFSISHQTQQELLKRTSEHFFRSTHELNGEWPVYCNTNIPLSFNAG